MTKFHGDMAMPRTLLAMVYRRRMFCWNGCFGFYLSLNTIGMTYNTLTGFPSILCLPGSHRGERLST
jgi:hypothetical protein